MVNVRIPQTRQAMLLEIMEFTLSLIEPSPDMKELVDAVKGVIGKLKLSLETQASNEVLSFTRDEDAAIKTALVICSEDPIAAMNEMTPGLGDMIRRQSEMEAEAFFQRNPSSKTIH
jgi:hypothetical protein